MSLEPLVVEFSVACDQRDAFELWTEKIATWWPSGHSMSGDPETNVTLEPRVGGRIFERTPAGVEHDWGEVLEWEPPGRLVYLWHIAADRSDATEVEIRFTPGEGGTEVTILHRGWERLGSTGPERRARNEQGWAGLIPHFIAAAGT
jgi:uncharacterized protein YndB with AHSA1/START domain